MWNNVDEAKNPFGQSIIIIAAADRRPVIPVSQLYMESLPLRTSE